MSDSTMTDADQRQAVYVAQRAAVRAVTGRDYAQRKVAQDAKEAAEQSARLTTPQP